MRSLCRFDDRGTARSYRRNLIDCDKMTLYRQVFPIVSIDLSQRKEMREKGFKKAIALLSMTIFKKKN